MRAVKFYWGVDSRHTPIYIEERSDTTWAITKSGFCLSKDGDWEYEPMPSSRDEEFLARCRYLSSEEAEKYLTELYEIGGKL